MDKLIQTIMEQFIRRDLIQTEDKEIYAFGLKMIFTQSLHLAVFLVLSFWFSLIPEGLCFFLAFTLVRIQAGGYHAVSNARCFVSSTLTDIAVLIVIKYTPLSAQPAAALFLAALALPVILKYAPMDHIDSPLDPAAHQVYRKRTLKALAAVTALLAICLLLGAGHFSFALAIGLFTEAVLLLLGLILNRV